jgi:AcrR family transcriptional regulator
MKEEKDKIIEAARDKFFEHGIYKITLDEVASDLRMSKKTVYKFFPSKEVLLKAIVKFTMGKIEREVTAITTSNRPFVEKMSALLIFIGTMTRRFSKQFQVDLIRFAPGLWREMEAFRREQIFPKVLGLFQQAKQEGLFRADLDVNLFYLVFISVVQGVMTPAVLAEQSFSAEQAFRGVFRLLLEGALTDEARKQTDLFDPTIINRTF